MYIKRGSCPSCGVGEYKGSSISALFFKYLLYLALSHERDECSIAYLLGNFYCVSSPRMPGDDNPVQGEEYVSPSGHLPESPAPEHLTKESRCLRGT